MTTTSHRTVLDSTAILTIVTAATFVFVATNRWEAFVLCGAPDPRLPHDDRMTTVNADGTDAGRLRLAATGGLVFVTLYVVHRVLQGGGPSAGDPATVAAYNVAHRGALLGSEIALGLALLAFLVFLCPLVPVLWRAGQETIAVAVLATGVVFIAMGFVSSTAETALVAVADSNQPAAVDALNQLQGRVPNVLATAALSATVALAAFRGRLVWRWLGYVSAVAAAVFGLGFVFSVVGKTPEGGSSIFGIAAFIIWMLLVTAGLWRAATGSAGAD